MWQPALNMEIWSFECRCRTESLSWNSVVRSARLVALAFCRILICFISSCCATTPRWRTRIIGCQHWHAETSQFVPKKRRKESLLRMAVLHTTSSSLFWVTSPSQATCFYLLVSTLAISWQECEMLSMSLDFLSWTQWDSKPPTISSE